MVPDADADVVVLVFRGAYAAVHLGRVAGQHERGGLAQPGGRAEVNGSQTVRRAYSASGGAPVTCVWARHTSVRASSW